MAEAAGDVTATTANATRAANPFRVSPMGDLRGSDMFTIIEIGIYTNAFVAPSRLRAGAVGPLASTTDGPAAREQAIREWSAKQKVRGGLGGRRQEKQVQS